jgi:hypothetical protein
VLPQKKFLLQQFPHWLPLHVCPPNPAPQRALLETGCVGREELADDVRVDDVRVDDDGDEERVELSTPLLQVPNLD